MDHWGDPGVDGRKILTVSLIISAYTILFNDYSL
jgi:hypothetical protein